MTVAMRASTSSPMKSGHRNGALPKLRPAPGEARATAAGALTSSDAEDPPIARSVPPPPPEPNSVPPKPPGVVPPGDPGPPPPGVEPPGPLVDVQSLAHGLGGQLSRHGVGGTQLTKHPVGGVGQLSKHGKGIGGVGSDGVGTGTGTHRLAGRQTGDGVGVGVDVDVEVGVARGLGTQTCPTHMSPTGGPFALADAMIPTPRLETANRIRPARAPASQRDRPGLPRRLM